MEHLSVVFAGGPWWLYALLVTAAGAIASLTYRRTLPELSPLSRLLLTALRTIGIAALLIALFEPILRWVKSETATPRIVLAIDHSKSISLLSKQSVQELRMLANNVGDAIDADEIMVFGEQTETIASTDSLKFDKQRTDIASVVTALSNRRGLERPGVVVLISDGNTNTGENPVYNAEKAAIGVYTIGIGDSIPPKDAGVTSVIVAGIATRGRPTNVAVSARLSAMPDVDVILILEEEGKEIGRDTIRTQVRDGRATSDFVWTPQNDGIRTLSARIAPVQGEHTVANNTLKEHVEVRSDQRTIVVFAGAPSPDVAFIKSVLTRDPSVKVTTFIQKQGATFYEGNPPPTVFDGAVACILIGFPTGSSPEDVVKRIAARCEKGLALCFIPSKDVAYNRLAAFDNVLPFRVATSRPVEMLVTPDVSEGATSDPLLKVQGDGGDATLWNTLPPIWRTETFVNAQPGAVTLSRIRTNNVPINQPLLMKREAGETRSIALLGYGLYRWKLLGEGPMQARGEPTNDVFGSFISNCISWLSVRQDERRVRIRATRTRFAAGEPVAFSGSVLDESFAPVTNASVKVSVTESGKVGHSVTEWGLSEIGGGRYSVEVGPLSEGEYSTVGTATLNGVVVGTDKSKFSVGALGLEEAATSMNYELLNTMSQRTGGVFAPASNWQSVVEALKKDPRLREVAFTSERDVVLWHLPWLLVIAIGAFTLEWVLRKRRGLV